MRYGVWTPLPNTVQPEPTLVAATEQLTTHGRAGERDLSFAFALATLKRAEELGFDLTLIAQRWLGPDPDCFMLAAALATHTSTMHIMPALHPGVITPQVAAKMLATLDRISGGRSAVNIVSGWWRDEFNIFSNNAYIDDEDARFRRTDEYVSVLKLMMEQPSVTFEGEFYQLREAALPNRPAQTPRPLIYAASRNARGREIVARECDVWFVPVPPGLGDFEANFASIARDVDDMRSRAARHGRELGFGISCHVLCAPTDEKALAKAQVLEELGNKSRLALISAKALGAGLLGSPGTIARRIERYDRIGVSTAMMHFHPMIEGMELFAREVMPLVGRTPRNAAAE
jgi:FMNH2-dependent dimethyl sulfone monooxygenase